MVFKVSKLYWPTVITPKNAVIKSKCVTSKSQKLMVEMGLIKPSGTGCFHILPIAQKVLDDFCNLISKYMNKINGQKITLPILTNSDLWKKSGRFQDAKGELFLLDDKHGREYILSPTHEESITDLINMSSPISYKQLPLRLYQIGTKFRDEIKPRFGLLRAKEFIMMDMYSFDNCDKEAQRTYQEVNEIFEKLYNALEIPWLKVKGSTGTIGGSESHEYHTISDIGEDEIIKCENCGFAWNKELYENSAAAAAAVECRTCQSTNLTVSKSIEIGHTFHLGDKYSLPLKAMVLQNNGKHEPLIMGCYGIGITRTLAACLEVLSTEDKLIWPSLLEPFDICIIPPKDGSKEQTLGNEWFHRIYSEIVKIYEEERIILDDRTNLTIGKRLMDSKKMGYPLILVIGTKATSDIPKFELHYVKKMFTKDFEFGDLLRELVEYKQNKENLTTFSLIEKAL